MAITLDFYDDAGLTTVNTSIGATQADDGTSPAVDRVVYLGSTASGKRFQAASNPGTDQIVVSIADSAVGSGLAATAVKLATSSGGLNTAVAGDPLSIGTEVLSGSANKVAIHVRIDTPAVAAGTYTDLSLTTNTLIEIDA
jgi:hypothetical protein